MTRLLARALDALLPEAAKDWLANSLQLEFAVNEDAAASHRAWFRRWLPDSDSLDTDHTALEPKD